MGEKKKNPISIIPDQPNATGITHFYKKDGQWCFMSEADWKDESKRSTLPSVCFATRHSISDFESRAWPDLDKIASRVQLDSQGSESYYCKY